MPPKKRSGPKSLPESWEHVLGVEFPMPIQLLDDYVLRIKLRGTFNLRMSAQKRGSILREAYRVLRPGGMLHLHLLTSDREIAGKLPRMPEPVARVEYAPMTSQIVQELESAQFVEIFFKRYSPAPLMRVQGAELRELLLTCVKPLSKEMPKGETTIVYRGPLVSVSDDFGGVYTRGEPVRVSQDVAEQLESSQVASQFIFLQDDPTGGKTKVPAAEVGSVPVKKLPLSC